MRFGDALWRDPEVARATARLADFQGDLCDEVSLAMAGVLFNQQQDEKDEMDE